MALLGGHRFAVSMVDVFPHGVYALGVEQAQDFNEKTKGRVPAKDKQSGEYVWTEEIVPGSGIRCVEFAGLTITPYIEEPRGGMGRARLAFSYRATAVYPQGKVPTATPPAPPASRQAPPPAGDGKAA
jgi:hypothetical protein